MQKSWVVVKGQICGSEYHLRTAQFKDLLEAQRARWINCLYCGCKAVDLKQPPFIKLASALGMDLQLSDDEAVAELEVDVVDKLWNQFGGRLITPESAVEMSRFVEAEIMMWANKTGRLAPSYAFDVDDGDPQSTYLRVYYERKSNA